MRLLLSGALMLSGITLPAFGQLSTAQKIMDFQHLAALYAKQYAPYGWKVQTYGYDLLDLRPWMDRINQSQSDLEFYEICSRYVSSLNDAHAGYYLPSTFVADAGVRADIYEGAYIIDQIDRSRLPASDYPFSVGDEVVSVDGKKPDELIADFRQFSSFGNTRATDRWAALYIGVRPQEVIPAAALVGDSSVWVIRRRNGNVETYTLQWKKSGLPLLANGRVPTPVMAARRAQREFLPEEPPAAEAPDADAPAAETTGEAEATPPAVQPPQSLPPYLKTLRALQRNYVRRNKAVSVRGWAKLAPSFSIPNFTQRLGRSTSDYFYSGTFRAGNYVIGFLRISDFEPSSIASAMAQYDREITFFKANTDGLVIDVMRNPGGYGCYAEDLMTRLNPNGFTSMGFSIRATMSWLNSFYDEIQTAKSEGAEQWQINLLQSYFDAIQTAFKENRGDTGPLPLCTERFERQPATDSAGRPFVYDKPLIVLTDEFTSSAGDLFAALMQDAGRGPLVGWRTTGAGGNVESDPVGFYSEGSASVTQSMMMRPQAVQTPDFPVTRYVENVGVRPDVEVEYMTMDNLLGGGLPFVEAFTRVITGQITQSRR